MNPETTKAEVIKQVQTQYAVDNARQLIEVSGQQDRIKAKARQRTTNNLSSFVRSIDQTPTLRAQAQNISPPHTLQTPILLSPHQPLTDTITTRTSIPPTNRKSTSTASRSASRNRARPCRAASRPASPSAWRSTCPPGTRSAPPTSTGYSRGRNK